MGCGREGLPDRDRIKRQPPGPSSDGGFVKNCPVGQEKCQMPESRSGGSFVKEAE